MQRILIDVEKKEIKEIIIELEAGKYVLPSFQRQYVWDEDDIKDLIDSIINNYPIGTIILWKPSHLSLVDIDPFSKPLIDTPNSKLSEAFYVIDGQQRLTSLLLLFKDWQISRGGEIIKCEVPISYNPTNKRFYKSRTRGINLSDLIKAFWLRDKKTLRKLMDETPDEQFEDMKEKVNRILDYKLPIYIMKTFEEDDRTFLSMAEAFIRVNKYGVRIGNLELMLSFLAGAISGELKEKIHELYGNLYDSFEVELQPVIRFTFSNFGLRQTQISRVNQFRTNIEKVKNLPRSDIITIFKTCNKSMGLTIELLKRELGLSNSRLLPSQIPLVTISTYFYYKGVNDLDELKGSDIRNIINWFVLTSFNGYYSSATDTKLDEDLNVVKNVDAFPTNELFNNMRKRKAKIKISKEDFRRGLTINVLRREGRAYLFMLYILLVKKNADDWNGKLLVQTPLNQLAKHHIFPKEYLEKGLRIDDPDERESLINNLGNVTFIHKYVNSEIADEPPFKYLGGYAGSLAKHFIPIDKSLWKIEQYQTFLEYRIMEIYSTGKETFGEIFE